MRIIFITAVCVLALDVLFFAFAYTLTIFLIRTTVSSLRGLPGSPVLTACKLYYLKGLLLYESLKDTFDFRPGVPTIFPGLVISCSKLSIFSFNLWNSATPMVVEYPANFRSTDGLCSNVRFGCKHSQQNPVALNYTWIPSLHPEGATALMQVKHFKPAWMKTCIHRDFLVHGLSSAFMMYRCPNTYVSIHLIFVCLHSPIMCFGLNSPAHCMVLKSWRGMNTWLRRKTRRRI